jgi:sugar phosphate isomerase/epimerase
MKIGINDATIMNTSIAREIEISSDLGYDFLELQLNKIEKELKLVGKKGVKEIITNSPISIFDLNAFELEENEEKMTKILNIANLLGCKYIISVPPKNPFESNIQNLAKTMDEFLLKAEDYNVCVAFEFLGFSSSPINNLKKTNDFYSLIRHKDNFYYLLDTFHLYLSNYNNQELIEIPKQKIAAIHMSDLPSKPTDEIKDEDRVLPFEGITHPLTRILSTIYHDICYQQRYSLELFNPRYWKEDPYDFLKRAYNSIEKIFVKIKQIR